MKSILFSKSSNPTFEVEIQTDIEFPITEMQEDGFETMCTIMETKGLTDEAIIQGVNLTKLIETSYQDLIGIGEAIDDVTISVVDYASSEGPVVIHTP